MAPPDADALISHTGFVRDLAFRLLRDAHEAEDVVQQVFLTAMRRPPETNRPLRPWLRRVARNLAIDVHRSRGRRERSERIAAIDEPLEPSPDIGSIDTAKSELASVVLALPEPYRTVVLMRFYDELSPGAIARRLDIPVETVRTRIKRGVAQLRGRLHGDDEEKRQLWAKLLVRLASEPPKRGTKLSRWSPTIYVPFAAAVGALSVWLWNGESAAATSPAVASTASHAVDPTHREELRPQAAPQKPLPPVKEAQLLRVRIVTDEGVLVPDARVDVYAGGDKVAEVRTDRNGELELTHSPGSDLELRVGMTRVSMAHSTAVKDTDSDAAGEPTIVRVPAASSVSGRVVDADGYPVPYARVVGWFGAADEDWRSRTPDQRSMADGHGNFALLGLPHQFRVEAYWAHFVARDTYVARLERALELKDVELRLCEPRTIFGQIVDELGIAVADADVRAIAPDLAPEDNDTDTAFVPRTGDKTVSRPDGTFVMTGVAPVATEIVIDHPDHAPHVIPTPPAGGANPDETLEVGLELGVSLDLSVTDGGGRPLRNAEARFFMLSGNMRRASADIAGRIRLEHLTPGSSGFLRVDASDREPDVMEIKKLGKKSGRLEFKLSKPRVVRGYVLDAHHSPIRGAKVTARMLPPAAGTENPAWLAARNAATLLGEFVAESDGRFVFPHTPWRAFRLDVQTPGGKRGRFEVSYDQLYIECAFDEQEDIGATESH
jgi:RNA polymerase sigma-70 factor (ECF subfamily)